MEKSHVAQQSDKTWSTKPAWRDRYYVADLHAIFVLSWGLDKHEGLELSSNDWPNTSVSAVICPKIPDKTSLPSTPATNRTGTVDISPISLASWTSGSASQGNTNNSSTTSPTVFSQMSTPPTSPALKTRQSGADFCHPCGQEFTGSPQNRRSNRLRHFRDSVRHNSDAGLRCPQQRCASTNPMRSDNLRQHLQKVHGLSSQADLGDALRRSKLMKVPRSGTF